MFKYKYTAIYWVIFTHQALYTKKKKSNSLHNNISHSTWLETFIHVRNLSLNFSFHASTKEIYYAHTHTHAFQWDTLDKYKNLSTAIHRFCTLWSLWALQLELIPGCSREKSITQIIHQDFISALLLCAVHSFKKSTLR